MTTHDQELEELRRGVSCATVLERLPPPWLLDRKGSTRSQLKYRRGEGEIIIVNHEGRGWWDPTSDAKGDVFDLVQHLEPGLSFGHVRKILRPFIGLTPAFHDALLERRKGRGPEEPPARRWQGRPPLLRGCRGWRYLTKTRFLPADILDLAIEQDAVRDGAYGTAWFAHRDAEERVSHVECRGPDFRGSLAGGHKSLFRLTGRDVIRRLAITEAPIDALSLAALEGLRSDTLYAATGGGIGIGTEDALLALLASLAGVSDAVLLAASDANPAGERHAARLAEIAAGRIRFTRLRPGEADWNDVLQTRALRSAVPLQPGRSSRSGSRPRPPRVAEGAGERSETRRTG